MGFFGTLLSSGPALNRLAKTVDECLNCLARFKYTDDNDELYKVAWLFVYGIQNSIIKWHWTADTLKVYVPNHPEIGRRPLNQIIMVLLNKLAKESEEAGIDEIISDIIQEGPAYKEFSYLISEDLKNKLKP